MNVTIKKESVLEGFIKAANIIPQKTGASYLRSMWIQAKEDNTITIMSTDSNIEFTGVYNAEVKQAGTVGINGKALVDLLRKLPGGDIFLILDEEAKHLKVEQGRRSYKMPIADIVWFQPLPAFPEENAVLWSGDYFQELIDRLNYCIHDDDSSEALACVYLKRFEEDKVDMCGLNGHQFALSRFMNDELSQKLPEDGLLIQKKYVNEIKKWLATDEIMLNTSERRFHLRNKNSTEHLSVPRAMYSYPDYLLFLSKLDSPEASTLIIDRKECMEALNRLNIFNNDNDRCAYFNLKETMAILSAQAQETGSAVEELDIKYNGSIERIAFPTKALIEILSHFQSSTLELTITTNEGPCGIKGSEDPDYLVLIMPMKITETSYYSE